MTSVASLNASSISLLFSVNRQSQGAEASVGPITPDVPNATGFTDDLFKAGNAIGNIIAIVSKMNSASSLGMFTMEGATRTDMADGGYSLTKTGVGLVDPALNELEITVKNAKQDASGTGVEAERAKAYLKAVKAGTVEHYDMASLGVSATMTRTDSFYADGSQRGTAFSFKVLGMDDFIKNNTVVGEDAMSRDRATGKYWSISQNGTQFTYNVW